MSESRLFQPYRALGLITDDLPFALTQLGSETFAVVSIGRAFQIFKCDKLGLSVVSPLLTRRISALCAERDRTFTASGADITRWDRSKPVGSVLRAPTGAIRQLLSFGEALVSVGEDGTVNVWSVSTSKVRGAGDTAGATASLHGALGLPDDFSMPTFAMHPSTYLNKIVLADGEGRMQLWNIRTRKAVYAFKGWPGTAINVVEQSPVVDVVAVGLADGRIVVHNLRFDATVTEFHQASGPVVALSFRNEAGRPPLLVSGSSTGEIVVWDLEAKQLHSRMAEAHDGAVLRLAFLPGEPVLLSSGADNSLKMWIFDQSDGSARLLRSREGHTAPPTRLQYYGGETLASLADGADGHSAQILSAGRDRAFRVFHAIRDAQSRELSQGHVAKRARKMYVQASELKLPHCIGFATADVRARDWCDIITCHANDPNAYTWHFKKRAIGKLVLTPPAAATKGRRGKAYDYKTRTKSDRHKVTRGTLHRIKGDATDHDEALPRATAVAISACGNFGVVGNDQGGIYRYNMQSGMLRGSYPAPPGAALRAARGGAAAAAAEAEEEEDWQDAGHHGSEIRGLAVDNLNQTLVSVGLDGSVAFWCFNKHKLLHREEVGSPVSALALHRDSNLLALLCDDFQARVYDMTTRRLVRRFKGHTNRLTDAIFTPDARWLLTCSMDSSVRVWDLPTGKCVDWAVFEDAPTGIAASPTGDFFATSHVDQLGIFLWANKASFTAPDLGRPPAAPTLIDMPMPAATEETEAAAAAAADGGQTGEGGAAAAVAAAAAAQTCDAAGSAALGDTDLTAEAGSRLSWHGARQAGEACTGTFVELSDLPAARWNTLAKLELIKERNKPKEPPKAPEQAPFFLPSTKALEPTFKAPDKNGEDDDAMGGAAAGGSSSGSRIANFGQGAPV